MKPVTIGLTAAIIALAIPTIASARSHHRHHHQGWSHSMNMSRGSAARSDPNGTAGGPTSVSGTGSSKFGGQIPGSAGAARQ
jgi:hypothetical protein